MTTTAVISQSEWLAYTPAVILLLGLAWVALNPFARWRLRAIPGPTPLPLLGSIVNIATRDITHLVADYSHKYGKAFTLWMGSQPWVVLSDPGLIRKYSFKLLSRPFSRKTALHTLTGEAFQQDRQSLLFMRNGPEWRLARRAFEQSLVHPASLAAHMPAVNRGIARALPRLDRHAGSGEPLEACRFLAQTVLGILGEAAFGVDFHTMAEDGCEADPAAVGRQLADAVRESLDCININNLSLYQPLKWMFPGLTPLWYWLAEHLPDKNQLRHMAARKRLADITRQLMAQWQQAARQREGGTGPPAAPPASSPSDSGPSFAEVGGGISSSSFLASLLEGRRGAQQHDRLTDVQVAGQCLIFLIAGFETTSATISYTLFLLASHPEAQRRLQQEVDQHVAARSTAAGGDGSGEAAEAAGGAAEPGQLPYLEAVLQESMRLYPSVSMTLRYASEDLDLARNGIVVPKGTTVLLATHAMMHDPAVWPQPEAFLPQRFLPGQGQGQGLLPGGAGQGAAGGEAGPGSAWAPFGLGPRMCVGNKFATMVAKAVLVQLVRRYTFNVHEKQVLEEGPGGVKRLRTRTDLTHMPRDGVWVSVRAR